MGLDKRVEASKGKELDEDARERIGTERGERGGKGEKAIGTEAKVETMLKDRFKKG